MGRHRTQNGLEDSICGRTPREAFLTGKLIARALAESRDSRSRPAVARSFVFALIDSYWRHIQAPDATLPIAGPPDAIVLVKLPDELTALAKQMGQAAAEMDAIEAGYLIGGTYTVMLPADVRSRLGAYYTPPAICQRLLDMATEAGVDWGTCRVLDPACGGGAFLSPVAQRMAEHLPNCDPAALLQSISRRLQGLELDPFAAWVSQVFLEATLIGTVRSAGGRMPTVVRTCDSLQQHPGRNGFDLVVGNPPYGRVSLSTELRARFRRSLFGHANLYGVFTDLALHFTKPGGVIAYVTPTSFLAGEYFKALRGLLGREAPPASIDFVLERRGVFEDVQQETLLAAYRRGGDPTTGVVHFISPDRDGQARATAAGSFVLPTDPRSPWIVQRVKELGELVQRMRDLPYRLRDYGYTVSTGPLVWNRHKRLLRDAPGKGRYPLIWAESVRPGGRFEFRSEKRNHEPYFEPGLREMWVVTREPCVLLQRTTAKEQNRRLIAAELPRAFVARHGAVVVENHLNMIRVETKPPKVSAAALAALLNTNILDQAFRCINGSVAVSAYELESLPLPDPNGMSEIDRLVMRRADPHSIERCARKLYLSEDS